MQLNGRQQETKLHMIGSVTYKDIHVYIIRPVSLSQNNYHKTQCTTANKILQWQRSIVQ